MQKRDRDLLKFEEYGQTQFESINSFFAASPALGLSSIYAKGRFIDVLHIDRGASTTLIGFHAAVPDSFTYPFFSGVGMTDDMDVNFLGFSDPFIGGDQGFSTGWFIGSEELPLQELVPSIIRHYISDAGQRRLIFFGSSAGGFAALYFSSVFPGSLAIAVNPRIDLEIEPTSFHEYAETIFRGRSPAELKSFVTTRLSEQYAGGAPNTVAYMQNSQDRRYFERHMQPFLHSIGSSNNIHFLVDAWGIGHVPPPSATLRKIVRTLIAAAPNWASAMPKLGFGRPAELAKES
ncbi:hypothetical protein [Arthrobacter sp.]|uniref:hypothetical protein n=1 Tax=Arthrobacter sp. TaxID=1667 RepID=UPI003A93A30C